MISACSRIVLVVALAAASVAQAAPLPEKVAPPPAPKPRDWRYTLDYEGEDRSWVGWSPQRVEFRNDDPEHTYSKSSIILSARISLTLPVLSFAYGRPEQPGGEWLVQSLPSMNLALTMINDHSSAVLPPSFNPRILRVAFRLRWWPDAKLNHDGTSYSELCKGCREYAVGAILNGWLHHSDGMFRNTFYDSMGNPTPFASQAARANLEDGDFATNYLGVKGWFRASRLDGNGDRPASGYFVSLEYQFHHGKLPGGLNIRELEPLWGRHHLLFDAHYRTGYQPEPGIVGPKKDNPSGAYWLVGLNAWYVIDAHDDNPAVSSNAGRVSLEAAYFVPKYLGPAGLFVRAGGGRNPLNLRFVENRNEVTFGLMLDTSQFIGRMPH